MDAAQQSKLGEIIGKVLSFFGRLFKKIKEDVAPIAISFTQSIKHSIESGFLPDLAGLLDKFTNTHIASDVVTWVGNNSNKFLAAELGLVQLPDDATPEQYEEWAQTVVEAIAGLAAKKKSELWTRLATLTYNDLKEKLGQDNVLTFAETVALIEDAYVNYKQLEAEQNAQ